MDRYPETKGTMSGYSETKELPLPTSKRDALKRAEMVSSCEPAELAPDTPRLYPLGDLLEAWVADAEAAFAARLAGTPRGPLTGVARLDSALGGFLAPGLHILHGEPGTGKTAFALQVAASCGSPALFVTTEMGPLELLRRITARVTNTYLGRLKSGELTAAASLELEHRARPAAKERRSPSRQYRAGRSDPGPPAGRSGCDNGRARAGACAAHGSDGAPPRRLAYRRRAPQRRRGDVRRIDVHRVPARAAHGR